MSGGLRRIQNTPFVMVPSTTITDKRLSFKARGILAYLLDKPDGWDVRAESIARDSDKDGREAVQSGLRELAAAGYYRLERRRMRDGTFTMGTAVSAVPVPEWVTDYADSDGKPVTVVEQADGTFDGIPAGQTGNGFSGSGSPVAGSAGAGQPRPIDIQTNTDVHTQTTVPAAVTPSAAPADTPPATPEAEVARWVYDHTNGVASFIGLQQIAKDRIRRGATPRQVADAMMALYRSARALNKQNVAALLDGVLTVGPDGYVRSPVQSAARQDVDQAARDEAINMDRRLAAEIARRRELAGQANGRPAIGGGPAWTPDR